MKTAKGENEEKRVRMKELWACGGRMGDPRRTRGVLCCAARKGWWGDKVPRTPVPPPPGPF